MRIKFLCPHCDRVCRVPAELAGKQGRCPGCQEMLEVPTESTLQSKRKSAVGRVGSRRSSARSTRASDVARRASERREKLSSASKIPKPSGTGPVSDAGPAEERLEELNADGSPLAVPASPAPVAPAPVDDLTKAETTRSCRHCSRSIPYSTTACPHCGGDAALRGVPWQILVALFIFLPAPLPGLIFAQFGLRSARLRKRHINLAWVAIGLNAFSMVANVLYLLGKGLNQ